MIPKLLRKLYKEKGEVPQKVLEILVHHIHQSNRTSMKISDIFVSGGAKNAWCPFASYSPKLQCNSKKNTRIWFDCDAEMPFVKLSLNGDAWYLGEYITKQSKDCSETEFEASTWRSVLSNSWSLATVLRSKAGSCRCETAGCWYFCPKKYPKEPESVTLNEGQHWSDFPFPTN